MATDDGRHFCLSCHLKGVCNSNCSTRNFQWTLSQSDYVQLVDLQEQLCWEEISLPLQEVYTPYYVGVGGSQASSLLGRRRRTRGSRVDCSTSGVEEITNPPPPQEIKTESKT